MSGDFSINNTILLYAYGYISSKIGEFLYQKAVNLFENMIKAIFLHSIFTKIVCCFIS